MNKIKSPILPKYLITALLLLLLSSLVHPVSASEEEKELFQVSQKSFEDGFYDVAVRYITQLLQDYPQTEKRIQANLLLGQCYFFKSQYLKAYEIFQGLLQYPELKDVTLYWLGETYLKGTDYRQAQEQYQQVIKLYPNSTYAPQSLYSLGWSYFEQNKLSEACQIFSQFLNSYPDHQLTEDVLFKLGESKYNLKDYAQTIKQFQSYLKNYPQSTHLGEVHFYIAESYYYLDDPASAALYYAKVPDLSYDNKLILMARVSLGWSYLKLKNYPKAEESFNDALKFSKEKDIVSDDIFLGQASLYSELGKHQEALKAYTQLIEQFPQSQRLLEALLGQANSFYQLEDYTNAIKSYQALIARLSDPQTAGGNIKEITEKSYFGLAWSSLKTGDIDAAIKNFGIIKDQTESQVVKVSALSQIGDAYQDSDRLEKAVEIYDNLLEEYPDSPYTDYIQYRQGIALLRMGKMEAATLSFQTLKSNFPKSKYLNDVQYYLGVAYFKKGDWAKAKDYVTDFLKTPSENNKFIAEAQYVLSLSFFNLQDYSAALKNFEEIIKKHPAQLAMTKNSTINIAKCYYKLGQIDEALTRFKAILTQFPNSDVEEDALIWIGDHYLGKLNFDEAIVYYTKFIERFPGSAKLDSIRYELAESYQAKGEFASAINFFKLIKNATNQELYAKAQIAIGEIFTQQLDQSSALATYQAIINNSPEYKRSAYVKMAESYKNTHNDEQSLEAYKNALSAGKGLSAVKDEELHFLLGDNYELLNQHDKAVEEYLKIPYLFPTDIPWIIKAYLRSARLFENDNKWEEAKLIYGKIIELKTEETKFAQERLDWMKENTH